MFPPMCRSCVPVAGDSAVHYLFAGEIKASVNGRGGFRTCDQESEPAKLNYG